MGCFFACFRTREEGQGRKLHLVSDPSRSTSRETVVSKNRLSSLFLVEEEDDSESHGKKSLDLDSPQINKEIRNEAKFLKACGTLPETPVEIRKASTKFKGSSPLDKNSEPSEFHSRRLNSSITKLQLDDKQIDQSPKTFKLGEALTRDSVSSEHTPSSCISNVNNTGRISISSSEDKEAGTNLTTAAKFHANHINNVTTSVSPWPSAVNIQSRNKSVRFECDLETSSAKGSTSEDGYQISMKFESPAELSVSKPYPKPTPLKLSDEMQTPGTVFPANIEILKNGKTRSRSQYVHSVLNPVENVSQWQRLKEDDINSLQPSGEHQESFEQYGKHTPKSEVQGEDTLSGKDSHVEASLSSWFKPVMPAHDEDNPNVGSAFKKTFRFGRTPADRPIIGMVAAHWIENEPSQISPKWWDGNGIPNSTNKYKEDQKVSWHATPFEERLEKALSEESLVSQKKNMNGMPVIFDEHDESDTALSQLQATSTHSKSVVSF